MCCYIGSFHWSLALIALIAYACVGVVIPLIASKASGDDGLRYRTKSGELSSFVLESLRGASETMCLVLIQRLLMCVYWYLT